MTGRPTIQKSQTEQPVNLSQFSFQPADEIVRRTPVPFSLSFEAPTAEINGLVKSLLPDLSKADSCIMLSLTGNPQDKLDLGIKFRWKNRFETTMKVGVNPRYIERGEEVAPYCYATESSIEYGEYRDVPTIEERWEMFNESFESATPEQLAGACYVLAKAAPGDPEVATALAALKERYPGLMSRAKTALSKARKGLIAEAKAKVASIQDEAVTL